MFTLIITNFSSIQSKMNFLSFQDIKPNYVLKQCSFLQEIQAFTSSMLDLHYFYVTFANFHCKSYEKNVCTMCRYFDSKNQIQSHYLLHEEIMCHLQVQIPANIPDLQWTNYWFFMKSVQVYLPAHILGFECINYQKWM